MKKSFSLIIVLIFLSFVAFAQQHINLMSYNIRLDVASDGENRWDMRKDKLTGLIRYHEADILGAQEVLHHQLQYMLNALPEFDFIGGGRDDGKMKGEYSCIFYRKDLFSVEEQGTFWLSPTPDSISRGWDAALNRVCTYALFKSKKSKISFWVFNTHFDHVGETARLESAKLIIEKIHEFNTENLPVFFMGDLNARPGESPAMMVSSALKNARTIGKFVYGPNETFNAFRFSEKPDRCIDYIFIAPDPRVRVVKFATLTDSYELKYPSDHFPVIATVLIEK